VRFSATLFTLKNVGKAHYTPVALRDGKVVFARLGRDRKQCSI